MNCPSLTKLEQLYRGELDGSDRDEVDEHVAICADCQKNLERLITTMHRRSLAPTLAQIQANGDSEWPANYRKLSRLGGGGFGDVFKAVHIETEDIVAVKQFKAGVKLNFDHLATIRHPNIVRVLEQGLGWLVLEYIEGNSLDKVGKLESVEAVQLVLAVADAVSCIHESGIEAHRDLKPGNILLKAPTAGNGLALPMVSDFGLAFAKGSDPYGPTAGTPEYQAPEVFEGKPSSWSDIWALGVTLYEILSGELPFGDRRADLETRIKQDAPKPLRELCPSIDSTLHEICIKCLEKQPSHRFKTARELRDALESWLDAHGGWPHDWPYPLSPIVGPRVEDRRYPRSASEVFTGAACEVVSGSDSRLVVATRDSRLAVYRRRDNGYRYDRSIRLNSIARTVAAFDGLNVVALVHSGEGRGGVQIWNVDTEHCRPLPDIGHIVALAAIPPLPSGSSDARRLAVVRSEKTPPHWDDELGWSATGQKPFASCPTLWLLDSEGYRRGMNDVQIPFRFTAHYYRDEIEMIAFGQASFAVIGKRAGNAPKEIKIFRIQRDAGSDSIMEVPSEFGRIFGVCGLPDGRLAVAHVDEAGDAEITFVGENGKFEAAGLPATKPHGRTYNRVGNQPGTYPLGWHSEYGLLLGDSPGGGGGMLCASIRALNADRKITTPSLAKLSEHAEGDRYEHSLCLADGRIAFISDGVITIAGHGANVCEQIWGGSMLNVSIVGCRVDGEVLTELNGDNGDGDWHRWGWRYESPPFGIADTLPSGNYRITPDGWELSWERNGSILYRRRARGLPEFWWDAAEHYGDRRSKISDVIGTGDGRCWADTTQGVVCITLNSQSATVEGSYGKCLAKMKSASNQLIVFDDGESRSAGGLYLVDPARPESLDLPTVGEPRTLQVGEGVSLIYGSGGETYYYSRVLERPVLVHGLRTSEHSAVVSQREDRNGMIVGLVSVLSPRTKSPLIAVSVLRVNAGAVDFLGTEMKVQLDGAVNCCGFYRGLLAIGYYVSEKVELRSFSSLSSTIAVAYLPGEPQSLAFTERPADGTFLLVAPEGYVGLDDMPWPDERPPRLMWFDITRFMNAGMGNLALDEPR